MLSTAYNKPDGISTVSGHNGLAVGREVTCTDTFSTLASSKSTWLVLATRRAVEKSTLVNTYLHKLFLVTKDLKRSQ